MTSIMMGYAGASITDQNASAYYNTIESKLIQEITQCPLTSMSIFREPLQFHIFPIKG